MKVLFTNDAPLIKYGLARGFIQAGHEVKIMMGEETLRGKPPETQAKIMSTIIDAFRPDFIFMEGHNGCELAAVGPAIKNKGVPLFYWAIEDPIADWLADQYAVYADYIFTTALECIPRYLKKGMPSELLLFGCNPKFHRKVEPEQEYTHDLVLVGTNYSNRYDKAKWFLTPLIEAGVDLKIWGLWWDDPDREFNLCAHSKILGGILPYEKLPVVYNSAKIILGMNCSGASITQTSMRPYEALACGGGILLAHYTKAQEAIFGGHIFQVKDGGEVLPVVKEILRMSRLAREDFAKKAQAFVYANHTYKRRAQQILTSFQKLKGGIE